LAYLRAAALEHKWAPSPRGLVRNAIKAVIINATATTTLRGRIVRTLREFFRVEYIILHEEDNILINAVLRLLFFPSISFRSVINLTSSPKCCLSTSSIFSVEEPSDMRVGCNNFYNVRMMGSLVERRLTAAANCAKQ
jgi:hypothetical protein